MGRHFESIGPGRCCWHRMLGGTKSLAVLVTKGMQYWELGKMSIRTKKYSAYVKQPI